MYWHWIVQLLKFPFEYHFTYSWDLQIVLCLSQHINCTINWEPFSVMLVTDAWRQQVKHLLKRTVKDDQHTKKVAFHGEETLVLSLLLEYSASLWSNMLYSLSSLVCSSLPLSKFSLPSILGCSMLHCICLMMHCMLNLHMLVESSSIWVETYIICFLLWNVWVALVLLISNSTFCTNSLCIKASSQSFFLVATSCLKTLALRYNGCLLAL